MFKSSFKIGSRAVGLSQPVYIIAEGALAHLGNLDTAKRMIDAAANAGADAFKAQAYAAELLFHNSLGEIQGRFADRELSPIELRELDEHCVRSDIDFIVTPHDTYGLEIVRDLDLHAIKLGSGCVGDLDFIRAAAQLGKPIIYSTGMHTRWQVEDALKTIAPHNSEVVLMHCVSAYPTPASECALGVIREGGVWLPSASFTGPVGWSDHWQGNLACYTAVARGAKIIEKHFDLGGKSYGQDYASAAHITGGWDQLGDLINGIRCVEAMVSKHERIRADIEGNTAAWAIKKMITTEAMKEGQTILRADWFAQRAKDGIEVGEWPKIIGRKLLRDLEANAVIEREDVDWRP